MLCKKREGVSREKQQPDDGRELVVVRLPKKMTLGRDGNEGHLAHSTQGPKLSNHLYPEPQIWQSQNSGGILGKRSPFKA